MKSFECPKSTRNYEKKIMLVTSDAWSMSRLSHRPSEPDIILKIFGFQMPYPKQGLAVLTQADGIAVEWMFS